MKLRPLIERMKVALSQTASPFFGDGKPGEWNVALYDRGERWDALIRDPEGHSASSQGHEGDKKAFRAVTAPIKDWKGKSQIWVMVYAHDDTRLGIWDMPLKRADFALVDAHWRPVPK